MSAKVWTLTPTPPPCPIKAWIEASTKGAVLIFTAAEIDKYARKSGLGPGTAGLLGGMGGGIAQAYATMGFCTCMKTAEITRHKQAEAGVKPPSTWAVFGDIYRREGIKGINKGVNAVAVRQCTNWGSRMGFARLAETPVRKIRNKGEHEKLSTAERIACSTIGGALATWNQPIEVVRVEVSACRCSLSISLESRASVLTLAPRLCCNFTDAIDGEEVDAHREADDRQHARVHLQGERHQGSLPRCDPAHLPRHLADDLHGLL